MNFFLFLYTIGNKFLIHYFVLLTNIFFIYFLSFFFSFVTGNVLFILTSILFHFLFYFNSIFNLISPTFSFFIYLKIYKWTILFLFYLHSHLINYFLFSLINFIFFFLMREAIFSFDLLMNNIRIFFYIFWWNSSFNVIFALLIYNLSFLLNLALLLIFVFEFFFLYLWLKCESRILFISCLKFFAIRQQLCLHSVFAIIPFSQLYWE